VVCLPEIAGIGGVINHLMQARGGEGERQPGLKWPAVQAVNDADRGDVLRDEIHLGGRGDLVHTIRKGRGSLEEQRGDRGLVLTRAGP